MNNHEPVSAFAADGSAICVVPTSNGPAFIIDAEDRGTIGPAPYFWNTNGHGRSYVRANGIDNLVSLARIIAAAGPREAVRFRDGNSGNLRKANLRTAHGKAKRLDAALSREPSREAAE